MTFEFQQQHENVRKVRVTETFRDSERRKKESKVIYLHLENDADLSVKGGSLEEKQYQFLHLIISSLDKMYISK